jgi:hypothetical protein
LKKSLTLKYLATRCGSWRRSCTYPRWTVPGSLNFGATWFCEWPRIRNSIHSHSLLTIVVANY